MAVSNFLRKPREYEHENAEGNVDYLGIYYGAEGQIDLSTIDPKVRIEVHPHLDPQNGLEEAANRLARVVERRNKIRYTSLATLGALTLTSVIAAGSGFINSSVENDTTIATMQSSVNTSPKAEKSSRPKPTKTTTPDVVTITPPAIVHTAKPEVVTVTPPSIVKTAKPEVITVTPEPIIKTAHPEVITQTPEPIVKDGCYLVYTAEGEQIEIPCSAEVTQALAAAKIKKVNSLLETLIATLTTDDLAPSPSSDPSSSPSASATPGQTPSPTESPTNEPNPEPEPQPKYSLDMKLLEINALGNSHTTKNGEHPQMASGTKRTNGLMEFIRNEHIDVGALQEFQKPQQDQFDKLAGNDYNFWPHNAEDGVNAVFWDRSEYEFVSGEYIELPYFNGQIRRYPIVLLRSLAEPNQEFYMMSLHNASDSHGNAEHERDAATRKEQKLVQRLSRSGKPVFVLGDANESDEFFCKMTESGILESAAGGSNGPNQPCKPAKRTRIDHILGSQVTFDNYTPHGGQLINQITDHDYGYTVRATLLNNKS